MSNPTEPKSINVSRPSADGMTAEELAAAQAREREAFPLLVVKVPPVKNKAQQLAALNAFVQNQRHGMIPVNK